MRRFANATRIEELLVKAENRGTKVDAFSDVVGEMWNSGSCDSAQITERIRELGYTGSERTVRRYLQTFRTPGTSGTSGTWPHTCARSPPS